MRLVDTPEVYLIQSPALHWDEIERYLTKVGGLAWFERVYSEAMALDTEGSDGEITGPLDDAEALVEFMGRLCYKSWSPGLNKNVTKVREDSAEYLANVVAQLHGSVFEHAQFSFVCSDVSRVETHEHVRHRVGVAISQESLRYVRLDNLGFWFPEWARQDEDLMKHAKRLLAEMELFQIWMGERFGLDDDKVPFSEKKHKTSFMRRFAPQGMATEMGWSANIRTLRFTIEQRTALGAEEEIRIVFDQIARKMKEACPRFFQDMVRDTDGVWTTTYRKV